MNIQKSMSLGYEVSKILGLYLHSVIQHCIMTWDVNKSCLHVDTEFKASWEHLITNLSLTVSKYYFLEKRQICMYIFEIFKCVNSKGWNAICSYKKGIICKFSNRTRKNGIPGGSHTAKTLKNNIKCVFCNHRVHTQALSVSLSVKKLSQHLSGMIVICYVLIIFKP